MEMQEIVIVNELLLGILALINNAHVIDQSYGR